jgi:hypothetical protein
MAIHETEQIHFFNAENAESAEIKKGLAVAVLDPLIYAVDYLYY